MRTRQLLASVFFAAAAALSGCGFTVPKDFPNSVMGTDGRPIVFDDIRKIINDPGLSDSQKRQALRDLGLHDEKLIDALLGL